LRAFLHLQAAALAEQTAQLAAAQAAAQAAIAELQRQQAVLQVCVWFVFSLARLFCVVFALSPTLSCHRPECCCCLGTTLLARLFR
jgi:hypothetical protein